MRLNGEIVSRGVHLLRLLFAPPRPEVGAAKSPGHTLLVISFPRSGTSWLGSIMENVGFPFTYYGELFAAISEAPGVGVISANYPGFRWTYIRAFLQQRRQWTMRTFEDLGMSSERILQIMSAHPGVNVVKVFPRHLSDEKIAELLQTFKPHVLFLRRNHHDRFISIERAKQTGEWQNAQYANVDITIDEVQFESFRSGAEAWYRTQKELCLSLGLSVTDVSYEELQDATTLRGLIEKLAIGSMEIDSERVLVSSLTKQGSTASPAEYAFERWDPPTSTSSLD